MIKALLFDFSYVLYLPQNKDQFNQKLIRFATVNQPQVTSYIFSASAPQNLESFRPKLVPPFVDIFSSKKLGLSKYKPTAYQYLASKIDIPPQQILFTDDRLDNITAAQEAGLQTIHFKNTGYFLEKAKKLLQTS